VSRLKDKVALVIGAGSSGPGWGNGKAASVLFAREGASVVAVDVDQRSADETRDIIRGEGGTSVSLVADATASEDLERVVDFACQSFGRVDILHNNVGVAVMGDPVSLTEDDWQRGIDLNLTSAFLACKHVLPHMVAQRSGCIVNVSSTASVQINQYPYFAYYAAKAGLNHLTRALAVRYAAEGVRANAILPGVMDTPLIHRQIAGQYHDRDEMMRARHAASPMGRMGDAWDVAYAALFLASDEARYITGVCLPVDGGKSCTGR
jgi:NAD(P)-dependent dehydrogenase (short-subunit alcohol dehydrogenase family)